MLPEVRWTSGEEGRGRMFSVDAFTQSTKDELNVGLPSAALPHVAAYKHSEHGNEKDKAVLVCVSHGYPLPTDWTWFTKEDNDVRSVCIPHVPVH